VTKHVRFNVYSVFGHFHETWGKVDNAKKNEATKYLGSRWAREIKEGLG
jgi:hypothetical protein